MQKFKGAELAAQFPPQGSGPSSPPEVGVAGGAAHVDVDDLREGVGGCCPAEDVIHPQCPRPVRRLLQLIVGDEEGTAVGEMSVPGSGREARLASWVIVCWDMIQREECESFGSCDKAKEWKGG